MNDAADVNAFAMLRERCERAGRAWGIEWARGRYQVRIWAPWPERGRHWGQAATLHEAVEAAFALAPAAGDVFWIQTGQGPLVPPVPYCTPGADASPPAQD